MKRLNSAIALIMALLMILSLGGCTLNKGTTWIAKSGDEEIPAGLYLLNVSTGYNTAVSVLEQMYMADETSVNLEDLWKNNLDGMSIDQWITEETKESVVNYVAIKDKFEELGFEFDEADLALIEQEVKSYWETDKDSYQHSGVSKDSIRKQVESRYRSRMIFDSIYGKGGEKEVSDKVLKDFYADNYTHIQYLAVSVKDLEGAELEKREELLDAAIKDARAGGDFVAILKELEHDIMMLTGTKKEDLPQRSDTHFDATISVSTELAYPQALLEALPEMEIDSYKVVKGTTELILVKKIDPMSDSENFEANRESILSAAMNDEFMEMVAEWGKAVEIEFNEKALKRYTAKKMVG